MVLVLILSMLWGCGQADGTVVTVDSSGKGKTTLHFFHLIPLLINSLIYSFLCPSVSFMESHKNQKQTQHPIHSQTAKYSIISFSKHSFLREKNI